MWFCPQHPLNSTASTNLASYPGPLRGGERAWYELYAHELSVHFSVNVNRHVDSIHEFQVFAGKKAHAHTVSTRPFLLPPKGLGTRLVETKLNKGGKHKGFRIVIILSSIEGLPTVGFTLLYSTY